MSATGLAWVPGLALAVGVLLSMGPASWGRRLGLAWYAWLGALSLCAVLVGQLVYAISGAPVRRIEDSGVSWLLPAGDSIIGARLDFLADGLSNFGVAAALAIALVAGAVVTRAGASLDENDRSSLARLAIAVGGASLVMMARGVFPIVAGWVLCGRAMLGGRADRRARMWSVGSDFGMALYGLSLAFSADAGDIMQLRVMDLGAVRELVWRGLPLSELATAGLTLAIVGRIMAPTGSWIASGGGGAYAVARSFAGAVLPWTVLALRSGKLLTLAPWGMATITAVATTLMLTGVARWLVAWRDDDPGTARVGAYARMAMATPVVAVGMGAADTALMTAVLGSGSALTFALAGGRVPMRGVGRWAGFAWLGVLPFGGGLVGGQLFAWARGHDSAASMGINGFATVALGIVALGLGYGMVAARVDTRDTNEGADDLRLGSRAALVVGLVGTALAFPVRMAGPSWLGESADALTAYGSIFTAELSRFHVGLRPEVLDLHHDLQPGLWMGALLVATLLPLSGYALGIRRGPEWLGSARLHVWVERGRSLAGVPERWLGGLAAIVVALWRLVSERIGAHASELLSQWGSDLRSRLRRADGRDPKGARLASVPWGSMLVLLVILGWLFFRPSIVSFGPTEVHPFGGLRPTLHRPTRSRSASGGEE